MCSKYERFLNVRENARKEILLLETAMSLLSRVLDDMTNDDTSPECHVDDHVLILIERLHKRLNRQTGLITIAAHLLELHPIIPSMRNKAKANANPESA